jgi:cation transport ATPase
MANDRLAGVLARVQGWYFVLTGVWALVHIQSFLLVTGPKTDLWLVKTVGVLVAVIGAALLLAARQRRIDPPIVLLAAGSALGLAGIDLVYALGGRISPIYLLDAVAELGLAADNFSR